MLGWLERLLSLQVLVRLFPLAGALWHLEEYDRVDAVLLRSSRKSLSMFYDPPFCLPLSSGWPITLMGYPIAAGARLI